MNYTKIISRILAALILFFAIGCTSGGGDDDDGGDGGNASGDTRVRFLHAITEQPVIRVFINEESEPRFSMNYGEMTPYFNLGEDRVELRLLSDVSPVPIFENNFKINDDTTMMFIGPKNRPDPGDDYKISAKQFVDIHEPFVGNRFLLRVVNASPTTDQFDVYVFRPNVPIEYIIPRDKGVNFGNVTNYTEGNEAQAFVDLIDAKSGERIYMTDTINFDENPVVTLYLLDQFRREPPLEMIISYDSSN